MLPCITGTFDIPGISNSRLFIDGEIGSQRVLGGGLFPTHNRGGIETLWREVDQAYGAPISALIFFFFSWA